ncbi:sensor histidine kinase [Flavobacterium gelatinilyticum]|uniref:sensor histidine kinase n=1 Tax=Flavobacterium gelatinilyticum TaxID=3003260 RepID=UPI0024813CD7|nr:ATP-binding protein [Flavobacterium gelatinilyticum]
MKFESTEEKLKEKIKELTCIFEISKIISQSISIEKKVLKKIISNIKKAWKYADDAVVEIQISDYNLSTSEIPEKSIFQISTIKIPESNSGFIKVHYPQSKYAHNPFLPDEQKLLDTMASEIENYLEKFDILKKKAALKKTIEHIDRLSILGKVTASIAHEVNNPLANILGYAELIKDRNTDPEIDSDITAIIDSVLFTREILKKILFFSRESPSSIQLQEVKPIVSFAFSFLKQNFQKAEIKNELIFKSDTIKARVDSVQIIQLFCNLIINALHASSKKSIIKTIIDQDSENLLITIEDHGHGIPAQIKQKIFEPFFTTKEINTGNGLGLSTVQEIIKNHHGQIDITDNFPSGTIFSIKLPLN